MADLDNTVSTRVADSTLKRINTYADENGMTKSEAVRNRLRAGLDQADEDNDNSPQYRSFAYILGISLYLGSISTVGQKMGTIGAGIVVATFIYTQWADR